MFGEGRIKTSFVKKWVRIRRFGNRDISFLHKFAKQLEERTNSLALPDHVDEQSIREMARQWNGSIQFTKFRGSLLGLDELLEDVRARFLSDDLATSTRPRDRRVIKGKAYRAIGRALKYYGGSHAREMLKKDHPIAGGVEQYSVDIAIANGSIKLVADVFSFEGNRSRGVAPGIGDTERLSR